MTSKLKSLSSHSSRRLWVIKIDSGLITTKDSGLDKKAINNWVEQIAILKNQGIDIVLVSSGAISEGVNRLGLKKRPVKLPQQQAASAVGQVGLIHAYENSFILHEIVSAQILLTHDDFSSKERYFNISSTLETLLELKVVPIINENDTVSTDEIKFGDNDILAALVANMITADRLIILTDSHNSDQNKIDSEKDLNIFSKIDESNIKLIKNHVERNNSYCERIKTKISAAKLFSANGGLTTITSGLTKNILQHLAEQDDACKTPEQKKSPMLMHRRWLASQLKTRGTLILRAEAAEALSQNGGSVQRAGLSDFHGEFRLGEMLKIMNEQGKNIGQGLSNYSAKEILLMTSTAIQIKTNLPLATDTTLVDHDNLILDL